MNNELIDAFDRLSLVNQNSRRENRRLFSSYSINQFDSVFKKIAKCYLSSPEQVRRQIEDAVRPDLQKLVQAFGGRFAMLAINLSDTSLIETGLAALAIEGFLLDHRESIMNLALAYAVALAMGVDDGETKKIIRQVSKKASVRAAEFFRNFIQEPVSLEEVGVKLDQGTEGYFLNPVG